ncbi:hypothetical protein J6590_073221 [Homalodisca vitripennis]|nr:hypothetical protein J6590_073221 [Homalodisca vitripennis]
MGLEPWCVGRLAENPILEIFQCRAGNLEDVWLSGTSSGCPECGLSRDDSPSGFRGVSSP